MASITALDLNSELTLAKLSTAITHEVEVKSDVAGLTFTTTTPDVAEGTPGNLKLKITKGLPAYATKVDVYYTVTGVIADTTLAGVADAATSSQKLAAQACTNGALTAEMALSTNAKADPKAGNVVITIKKIVVAEQTAKVEGATASAITVTTGTAFGLPELTATSVNTTVVKSADAVVTINGVTTDDAADYPVSNRVMALTVGKTADESTTEKHYTSDGSAQVVITVTPVIKELNKGALFVDKSATLTGIAATADVKVKDGANEEAITLTLTKSAAFDADKVVKMTIIKGADGETYTSETTTAATTVNLTIDKGALTGITGEEIWVIVEIADAP